VLSHHHHHRRPSIFTMIYLSAGLRCMQTMVELD
jgi:hypothetical protein